MDSRRFGLLAAATLLALAACDGSPTTTATPTPGGATTGAAATGECGGVIAKVQERLARPGVQGAKVEGPCTTVVVTTTLSDGDAGTARQLCDLAAEVAYTGGVKAIRVLGQSGTELAQGSAGAKCR